jgi:hypothetical protein
MDESALNNGKEILSKAKDIRKTRKFDNPILAHQVNHSETRRLPPPPPPSSSASPAGTRPVSASFIAAAEASADSDDDDDDAGTFDDIYAARNK